MLQHPLTDFPTFEPLVIPTFVSMGETRATHLKRGSAVQEFFERVELSREQSPATIVSQRPFPRNQSLHLPDAEEIPRTIPKILSRI